MHYAIICLVDCRSKQWQSITLFINNTDNFLVLFSVIYECRPFMAEPGLAWHPLSARFLSQVSLLLSAQVFASSDQVF